MRNNKAYADFPKIELHRHIEGSMRVDTLREMASKKNLTEYCYDDIKKFKDIVTFGDHKPDFSYFLSKFINIWYSSLEDIERIAFECVEDAYKDKVIYMEIRVNLDHYAAVNNFNQNDVFESINHGVKRAEKKYNNNIKVKYIFTLNRGKHSIGQMEKLVTIAKERQSDGVCGIDLAGDEVNYPAKDFAKLFENIKNTTSLGISIHAGETTNSASVWDAINYLHADRIGHGVKSIEDEKLIKYEIDNKIALELCPISNLKTGAVKDIESHPFQKLYEKGVIVTLNSDDPTIQSSVLTDDYVLLNKIFGFSENDFIAFNTNSIKSSFSNDEEKKELELCFFNALDNFNNVK